MTARTVNGPQPHAPEEIGGAVFDIGYRSYTGPREGTGRARRAIIKDGIRIALGLGRGGRAKALPWLFIVVLAGIGTVMAIIAGAAERIGGAGTADQMRLPSHGDYYGIASIIVFVFAAVVAPMLLCPDRREGVISLYLVRPLTGGDYVAARWVAFFIVMLGAVWLPQVIVFLGLAGGDPAPVQYLRQHWLDVPRFLLAGTAMAAYTTTLALLTASFTTRRAYASVFLVGLFVITAPFTLELAQELGGTAGRWISMFNLTTIPVHVNDIIFGKASEITENTPARELGPTVLVAWYFAWTLIPAAVLWVRYRRLSP